MDRKEKDLSGLASVIQEIVSERGEITPAELVDAARPESSPAHSAFEWDDSIAGEKYRLNEARRFIRVTEIRIETREERLVHVPSVKMNEPGVYKPISVVVQNVDDFKLAVGQAISKQLAAVAAVDDLRVAAEKSNRSAVLEVLETVSDQMGLVVGTLEEIGK